MILITPGSHISSALNMRDSCWIRSFTLTKAFGRSQKDSYAFVQASAREASKVEALLEAKMRKQNCHRSGRFPRPTSIQQSRP